MERAPILQCNRSERNFATVQGNRQRDITEAFEKSSEGRMITGNYGINQCLVNRLFWSSGILDLGNAETQKQVRSQLVIIG